MANKTEVERLDRLEAEVRNNTRQLEKIITNDLPHLHRATKWSGIKQNFTLAFMALVLALQAVIILSN